MPRRAYRFTSLFRFRVLVRVAVGTPGPAGQGFHTAVPTAQLLCRNSTLTDKALSFIPFLFICPTSIVILHYKSGPWKRELASSNLRCYNESAVVLSSKAACPAENCIGIQACSPWGTLKKEAG